MYCSAAPWESRPAFTFLVYYNFNSQIYIYWELQKILELMFEKPFINGKISLWTDSILDKKGRKTKCNQGTDIKLVSLFDWTIQTSHRQSLNPHYYHFVYCHFGSWPKVHQFNVSCSVNKNILWFDVSVSKKKAISNLSTPFPTVTSR